jgi:hypothetical protein
VWYELVPKHQDLNLASSGIHCNIAMEDDVMTNRLLSLLFAASLTCLALALSLQRRTHLARPYAEKGMVDPVVPEVNVPGFSFSKN